MNSVAKNLALSCTLVVLIGLFLAYKLWSFGPAGADLPPLGGAGGATATPGLPPIHETFAGLKAEIREIVANQERDANPFHTTHFEPPPPPAPPPAPPPPPPEPAPPPPPPPPPPPVTREVALRYQGFFEAIDGTKKAYLRKEESLLVLTAEEQVIDGWKVARIAPRELVLIDAEGEELLLDFQQEKKIQVAIKESK